MTTLTTPTLPTGPAGPHGTPVGFDAAPARRRRNERFGLAGLLFGTALLYMVSLGASGYANQFYAAAVQAGTKSWKAFFFGSFDSSNFITVDKPPLSLWPMELAGRLFGFNTWSMLLPQAIEGVLTVWLLYATVRRWFGPSAGLIAGAAMALTPVAVLMFRFNNPDALMTLLVVVAAYCVTRALEQASTRWLTLAGAAIGFSFLVKGLQPFTVVPALALAYAVAAPTALRTRLLQLLAAAGGIVVGAGWWVLAVALTPAGSRPYIGGSTDNSALGLAFGYNGLGRLTGNETGNGGGGGPGAGFSGKTGVGRLFNSLNGGQISWLLPAALIALVALLVVTRRTGRTDRTRAAALLWGGWLLVTGGVLSFAGGIIHTYYTVELAPAIAALVGVAAVVLWRERRDVAARAGLVTGVLATGLWDYALLRRTPNWHPELGYLVLAATAVATGALLVPAVISGANRRALIALGVTGALSFGAGSAAYAVDTAATSQNGGIPSAGPAVAGAGGFGGAGRGPGGRPGGLLDGGAAGEFGPPRGGAGYGSPPGGAGFGPPPGGAGFAPPQGSAPQGAGPQGVGQQGVGQPGGRPGGAPVSAAVSSLLKATTTTWAAATVGSQAAAPLELATGKAIMAIGGFNGSDPTPTLAQFEKLVQQGKVRYFIGGGRGGAGGPGGPGGGGPGGGGTSTGTQIATWVAAHYSTKTVGGTTVYDLTQPTS